MLRSWASALAQAAAGASSSARWTTLAGRSMTSHKSCTAMRLLYQPLKRMRFRPMFLGSTPCPPWPAAAQPMASRPWVNTAKPDDNAFGIVFMGFLPIGCRTSCGNAMYALQSSRLSMTRSPTTACPPFCRTRRLRTSLWSTLKPAFS